LQVIGGSYLARHIHNVDLRVNRMDKDKDWQRIRKRYVEGEVLPQLEEGKKILQSLGFQAPIEVRIVEGKVSDEIIRLTQEEAFSTIIMGRRGLSPLQAMLLGSVTRSVLSLAEHMTVYVAAQEPVPTTGGPIFPILLPVDGSESSLAAVRQAAALAQAFRPMGPSLTLIHVVDIALLGMNIQEDAHDPVEKGENILAVSRGILQEAGLAGLWDEKLVSGEPAQAIVQQAEAGGYSLILMGSRGLSGLAKLLIGSVTNSVVHTVSRAAVAVVYS
jgi:nucleotide-binding universal stress UspA family protein